jgi:excisionase family DNA binding protein
LTPRELAARLKISPVTVRRMWKAKELPWIKVGERARFDYSEVIAKLRGQSR